MKDLKKDSRSTQGFGSAVPSVLMTGDVALDAADDTDDVVLFRTGILCISSVEC